MMRKFFLFLISGLIFIFTTTGCGTQEIELPVDQTPPTISITSPADNSIITQNQINVEGTVSEEGSGIKEVVLLTDTVTQVLTPDENGRFSYTITGVTEGTVNIVVQVTDEYGNITSKSIRVTVDLSPPEVSLISPEYGETVKGVIPLSASASDINGIKEVVFFDGNNELGSVSTPPYVLNLDTTTLSDGSHSIRAKAIDNAEKEQFSSSVTITVDNTPPAGVSITSPSNNSYVRDSITVTASASDNNSIALVEFLVDNTVFASDSSNPYSVQLDTTSLSDGVHTLSVRAIDTAGNQTTSSTINIYVDNTPPTISIDTPVCGDNVCNSNEAPGGMLSSSITVSTTAEDGQNVTLLSNGNPIGTGIVSGGTAIIAQGTPLTEGINLLTASVSDVAGNSSTSAPVSVTLDTTLNIAIVNPHDGEWLNASSDEDPSTPGLQISITVSTDAEDGNVVTVTGGDSPATSPVNSGFATITVTFSSDGQKNITASVSDTAGNSATSPLTLYYDSTVPYVTITSPSDGQIFKSICSGGEDIYCIEDSDPATPLFQTPVTISANDNLSDLAGKTVEVYSNDVLVGSGILSGSGPWTATVSVSLREGKNALYAKISDSAGNTGTSSTVQTYTFTGYPGSISGFAYDACTYSGVATATVELASDPAYNFVIAVTTTDTNGFFTLRDVPPGQYLYLRVCKDEDMNGKCEIKDGFGDGGPGIAGDDDDGDSNVDNCEEYNPGIGSDTIVDRIGFYDFSYLEGPIIVEPGKATFVYGIPVWIGDDPSWFTPSSPCEISGTINDQDSSWGNVNTIIGTTTGMVFGEIEPTSLRASAIVQGGTTQQPFTIYEQGFAPSDSPDGHQFILIAGKDINGNGRIDINSEPITVLGSADCNTAGLSFTLPPKVQVTGTVYGDFTGWSVIGIPTDENDSLYNFSASATDVNPDGTYTLTLFGGTTYEIVGIRDKDGFYYDTDNELSVMASINPVQTWGGEVIGGVNILIPPVRTISGNVIGSGTEDWAVLAFSSNSYIATWLEPGSHSYLMEVFPGQYMLEAFGDRNSNLYPEPREGEEPLPSVIDVLTDNASGVDISVDPDIVLKNMFIAGDDDLDRLPEPGETVPIYVQFINYGADALNVSATLQCLGNCSGITINTNTLSYPSIQHYELTSPSNYSVTIGSGVPRGRRVIFKIDISEDGGYSTSETFYIVVGEGHKDNIVFSSPSAGVPVPAGSGPNDIAIAFPTSQTGYIPNQGSGTITVIDAVNDTVTAILGTGGCPYSVVVSDDNQFAYVSNPCNNEISVIDVPTNTITNTFVLNSPVYQLAISPDGSTLWGSGDWSSKIIYIIDTTTGEIEDTIRIPGGADFITFSSDGEQVFASINGRIWIFNAFTHRIQRILRLGIYYDEFIYYEFAVDRYALYLYAFGWNGTMYRVDLTTYNSTSYDFSADGIDYPGAVAMTPDGAFLYFTEKWGNDHNVYVIDLVPPLVQWLWSVPVGTTNSNTGIAFTKEGDKAWVTTYSDNTATPLQ